MSTGVVDSPFRVDFRIAEDPLASLRFEMDSQAADILSLIETIEAEVVENKAEYAKARDLFRQAERRRTQRSAQARAAVALMQDRADSLRLGAEIAALEQRLDQQRRRLDALREQYSFLRRVSIQLGEAGSGDPELLLAHLQLSQAERQLYQLISQDFDGIADELLEVPMQTLSNMVFEVELLGRRIRAQEDPSPQSGFDAGGSDAIVLATEVQRSKEAANVALQQLQSALERISPLPLFDDGLVHGLRHWLRELAPVQLHVVGAERRLAKDTELAIFRIVQEAVVNAMEHGAATRIDIILSFSSEGIRLVVRDDGEGFDAVATMARLGRSTASGLLLMRQRAEACGGSFDIRSAVGEGTEVRASFS